MLKIEHTRGNQAIFTFHHTNPCAWWTILTAVQQGGFRIVDFFPVQSEYKVNPHIRNKQALDMDLVLICRKRSLPFQPLAHTPADAILRKRFLIWRTLPQDQRERYLKQEELVGV